MASPPTRRCPFERRFAFSWTCSSRTFRSSPVIDHCVGGSGPGPSSPEGRADGAVSPTGLRRIPRSHGQDEGAREDVLPAVTPVTPRLASAPVAPSPPPPGGPRLPPPPPRRARFP